MVRNFIQYFKLAGEQIRLKEAVGGTLVSYIGSLKSNAEKLD